MRYDVEHTDTFGGEANYCWVNRHTVTMPELTHYGYDGGQGYGKADKVFKRELVRRAKALCGLTGVRCETREQGDLVEIRPRGLCQVVFVTWHDDSLDAPETAGGMK